MCKLKNCQNRRPSCQEKDFCFRGLQLLDVSSTKELQSEQVM